MRKVYIILLLVNLAFSQYGGGSSDSSYSSSSYDSSDSSYSSSSYDSSDSGSYYDSSDSGSYYDSSYSSSSYDEQNSYYSSDSSSYYDSSYSSSSSDRRTSKEEPFWDTVNIIMFLLILTYLAGEKFYSFLMEETWEWDRFRGKQIILPAQYNIEETKQLYLRTRWSIDFKQKNELYGSEISKVEINQINNSPSVHKLSLRGKDKIGSWSASGFISFDDIIRIQFKKQYDDMKRAGQTGQWKSLYYEGQMVSPHLIEGVWFFKGFERHPFYSGTFKLKLVD